MTASLLRRRLLLQWPLGAALGVVLTAGPSGCVVVGAVAGFAQNELLRALLDRLDRETADALQRLGLPGGFAHDPQIRLTVPPGIRLARRLLVAMGWGPVIEILELQLNEAAEQVAQAAQPVVQALLPALPWRDEIERLYRGETDPVQALRRLATAELRERLLPLAAQAAERTGLDRTWADVQDAVRPIADARNAAAQTQRDAQQAAEDALRATEPPEVRAARHRLNDLRQAADAAQQLDLGEARRYVADRVVDGLFTRLHQAFDAAPLTPPQPVDLIHTPTRTEPAPVVDALPRRAGL